MSRCSGSSGNGQLTGTKFGCGIGMCGSCTVHIDGKAQRSCQTPVGSAQGKKITTIEGLPENHPVKRAWVQEQVPQCGYCDHDGYCDEWSITMKRSRAISDPQQRT